MRHIPHARITGLPVCPELTRDTIPHSRDVGHFLSVTGTVIRTSVTKVLEYERDYVCTKCRHVFTMQADFDQFYTFAQLTACPNPDGCNSKKFSCLSGGSEPATCRDYQEIKIQEQVQRLSVGSIPRSVMVVLEDDLVDGCKSGDDVTVYGVMCQRWKPFSDGTCCDVELVLKANNIEVNNQQAAAALIMKDVQKEFEDFWNSYKHDPIAGRNQILLSLCPQVFGMYLVKLAVAMVLAGGVQRIDSSGTKIRGECHMLLVGDPGTGKSQFLKYAAKIMPRSILTAGIGSTSAGLTVAAVKDGGDWHLEAGALVLSDGGLCCIDEFNSIKEQDRISIHEAMEQQSISVAKAGMVCKLNTRTTILAATNPKGPYDPNEPLSVNVALASPLLSRFDLVLVLMDTRNEEWDHIISSFILEDRGLFAETPSFWTMEKMKAYFSVIKHLQPQMSEEANSILKRYYQLQRQSDSRSTARTTIRMLESLSRLAEAHARLMYRETVTIEDAVMAVSVMECSMQGGALLGNVNALLTSFPADPSKQYQTQCQILLKGLNLPLLLQREMDRLYRIKSNTLEASPPTRDTIPINSAHHHDITSNCNGDVFDFYSITPSLLPGGMALPIITSTQEPLKRKSDSSWSEMSTVTKAPNCQTEDILCNSGSTCDALSDLFGTVISASEEENKKKQKNENIEEQCSITREEQAKRHTDEKYSESFGCVFQKVSKNMRDQRLRELEVNHQQCNREGGEGQGNQVVSVNSARKNVTDVLDTPSESLISSTQSFVKSWDQIWTKNNSVVLQEKVVAEAETRKKMHAKLPSFVFRPRKITSSVHKCDLNVIAEFQNQCNSGNRDFHTNIESGVSKQKPVSDDNSASPHTDTEKNKRQNQNQILSEDRRKQMSCASDVQDSGSEASLHFTSEELGKDIFSLGKDEVARVKSLDRIKGRGDTENLCHQQRTGVNAIDETKVDSFTCVPSLKPSTYICGAEPSESGHTKPAVAYSTLAKLSRFSFICPTESTTTARMKVEKSPLRRACAEWSRGNGKNEKTLRTKIIYDKINDILPPPATELTAEQKHEQGTESPTKTTSKTKCIEKQIEPAHSAKHSNNFKVVNDGPVVCQNTVTLKKRKHLELGLPPSSVDSSRGLFSGLSLFGSVDLASDVLDTDWDREVAKKANV
nr:DNA helicase MCM9 isoform X2 [Scatophagus argus]